MVGDVQYIIYEIVLFVDSWRKLIYIYIYIYTVYTYIYIYELLATPNLTYPYYIQNDDKLLGYELPLRSFNYVCLWVKNDEAYKTIESAVGSLKNEEKSHHMCKSCC